MCLLAVLFQATDDCPLALVANREESYARQGTLPQLWPGEPRFLAGCDPVGGGTWLGVNQHGVLAAVTNRRTAQGVCAARSRGLLCRDLLEATSARQANECAIEELASGHYAGCNLLAIDGRDGFVVHADDVVKSVSLASGFHVLTAGDVNDRSDPRVAFALEWLRTRQVRTMDEWLEQSPRLCRRHGSGKEAGMCLHGSDRGTVSSSVIALATRPEQSRWLHAQGPPCTAPYADCSPLLHQLFVARA